MKSLMMPWRPRLPWFLTLALTACGDDGSAGETESTTGMTGGSTMIDPTGTTTGVDTTAESTGPVDTTAESTGPVDTDTDTDTEGTTGGPSGEAEFETPRSGPPSTG